MEGPGRGRGEEERGQETGNLPIEDPGAARPGDAVYDLEGWIDTFARLAKVENEVAEPRAKLAALEAGGGVGAAPSGVGPTPLLAGQACWVPILVSTEAIRHAVAQTVNETIDRMVDEGWLPGAMLTTGPLE